MQPEPNRDASLGQLEVVALTRVNFEVHRDFGWDFDNLSYRLEFDTVPGDVENLDEIVDVHLHLRVVWEHTEEGPTPFDLEVTVTGGFTWADPDVDPEYLRGWLKFNGTYLLWPYARTHIANLTSASGLPPLTIMTLQVPRPSLGQETTEFARVEPDAPAG